MMREAGWKRGYKAARHRWSDPLSKMDPLEFERLIARYFEEQGYRVEHVGTGGRATRYDGGIDLKLYRGNQHVVVQCKRWNAYQVPHTEVHQLLGVIRTAGATRGIFINSGEFTRAAIDKMQGIPEIRLVDGHELREMLGKLLDSIPSPGLAGSAVPSRDYSDVISGHAVQPARVLRPIEPDRRLSRSLKTGDDWDWGPLLLAVAVLLVILVSCIRSTTERREPARVPARQAATVRAKPVPRPVPVVHSRSRESQPVAARPEMPTPRKQTPEEAREAKRRADAAIEVIKASTPEM